jgi:hypothetical protein
MCTVVLYLGLDPEQPVVLAANRDERLDRPAAPPAVIELGGARVLRPLDLEAGGTWIGLSERGLLVALTNRFDGRPPDPRRPSRGRLVLEALHHRSARAALDARLEGDPGVENPHHLILVDRREAFVVVADGQRFEVHTLGPGRHVVTERSFDAAPTRRPAALEARLPPDRVPDDETLIAALAWRDSAAPLEGATVSVPERGYGTRSSLLLRLGSRPGRRGSCRCRPEGGLGPPDSARPGLAARSACGSCRCRPEGGLGPPDSARPGLAARSACRSCRCRPEGGLGPPDSARPGLAARSACGSCPPRGRPTSRRSRRSPSRRDGAAQAPSKKRSPRSAISSSRAGGA